MMDHQTTHALAILRRVVAPLPDRRALRALAHLDRRVTELERRGAPAVPQPRGMLTRADEDDDPPPTAADVRPKPTAAQWRAVRQALEKFCGLGQWGSFAGHTLPPFELRWDDPDHLCLYADKAGVTATFADGSIAVCVRTDQTPDELHRTMLHELQHVLDHRLLHVLPLAVIEERARQTAARLTLLQ